MKAFYRQDDDLTANFASHHILGYGSISDDALRVNKNNNTKKKNMGSLKQTYIQ